MNSQGSTDKSAGKSEFTDNLNLFRQIEFFSGVPVEVVKLFALLCQRTSYNAGDVIFSQGDDDGCSYYIISGKVNLNYENKDGNEVLIREYGPENYFGILSLMTPIVKQFSLVAAEETSCVVMTRKAFSKVVDQFPNQRCGHPLDVAGNHLILNRLGNADGQFIRELSLFQQLPRDPAAIPGQRFVAVN